MNGLFKKNLKNIVPHKAKIVYRHIKDAKSLWKRTRPLVKRQCPICGFEGFFGNAGKPPRIDSKCSRCGSLERHRLFWLWFKKNVITLQEPILHFAPEPVLEKNFREKFINYKTADLFSSADLKLDIEKIDLPDESVNTVICNHVLEHVDDAKALREIKRILSRDGLLLVSVPIIEAWEQTYENKEVQSPTEREVHFGQDDHVRFYGRDFRKRVLGAGFSCVDEFTAEGEMVVEYGLIRGEKLFIYKKKSLGEKQG